MTSTPKMDVLVVGGEPTIVDGNLGRKLNEVGLNIASHLFRVPVVDNIPSGCKGVVVVWTMAAHGATESVRRLAKEANIPCAVISHKWSLAWPNLQRSFAKHGIALGDKKPILMPGPGELHEATTEYILQARQQRGYPPKIDEVQGALHRIFDNTDIKLDREDYVRSANLAAVREAHLRSTSEWELEQEDQDMTSKKDRKAKKAQHDRNQADFDEHILSGISIVLEERPERILDPSAIEEALRRMLHDDELPANGGLKNLIEKGRKNTKSRWKLTNTRRGTPNEKTTLRQIKEKWLTRMFEQAKQEHREVPTYRHLDKEAKRIFGSGCQTYIREIKDRIYGVQRVNVEDGYTYYVEWCAQRGYLPRVANAGSFRGTVRNGVPAAVKTAVDGSGGRKVWMMTTDAIEKWAEGAAHQRDPDYVPPCPVPCPPPQEETDHGFSPGCCYVCGKEIEPGSIIRWDMVRDDTARSDSFAHEDCMKQPGDVEPDPDIDEILEIIKDPTPEEDAPQPTPPEIPEWAHGIFETLDELKELIMGDHENIGLRIAALENIEPDPPPTPTDDDCPEADDSDKPDFGHNCEEGSYLPPSKAQEVGKALATLMSAGIPVHIQVGTK